ncbi:hypothetical protein [Actinomadura sp. CNU-125]|uniref:hypothetical protein n=1 Tax=Actinomadura sp. CNU-125 TaxID=1904961 RepID=UPI001300DDFA|nr:hypothetical protein [Actinomadura sp. CNU-125]
MADRQFRITSIELDKDEHVTEITAVIRQDAIRPSRVSSARSPERSCRRSRPPSISL